MFVKICEVLLYFSRPFRRLETSCKNTGQFYHCFVAICICSDAAEVIVARQLLRRRFLSFIRYVPSNKRKTFLLNKDTGQMQAEHLM